MQISYVIAPSPTPFCEEQAKHLSSFLPPQRQQKLGELKNESKRQISLLAGLLLSRILCERLATTPDALQFSYAAHGKPFLPDAPALSFSLSHSGLCAAIVTDTHPVGLDVERVSSYKERVVTRFFSAEEQACYRKHPTADTFFYLWTRKEAYVKQLGCGFSMDATSFDVESDALKPHFYSTRQQDYWFSLYADDAHLPLTSDSVSMRAYSIDELYAFFSDNAFSANAIAPSSVSAAARNPEG